MRVAQSELPTGNVATHEWLWQVTTATRQCSIAPLPHCPFLCEGSQRWRHSDHEDAAALTHAFVRSGEKESSGSGGASMISTISGGGSW